MSPREKKLLIFFGATLLIIVNFIAFNKVYLTRIKTARADKLNAETRLKTAETQLRMFEVYEPEMKWLEQTGTAPASQLRVRSELQEFIRRQATTRGLDVRKEDIRDYERGTHFGRVKVTFKVTGRESSVISWLTSIHRIEQRQVVTRLEIETQNNDPTNVEVEVDVEKWIIPAEEI